MKTLKGPAGNVSQWLYDDLGRVETETNAESNSRHYEYDAVGNLIEKTVAVQRNSRGREFTAFAGRNDKSNKLELS